MLWPSSRAWTAICNGSQLFLLYRRRKRRRDGLHWGHTIIQKSKNSVLFTRYLVKREMRQTGFVIIFKCWFYFRQVWRFVIPRKCQDRFCSPRSFLSNGYEGASSLEDGRRGRITDRPLAPICADLKMNGGMLPILHKPSGRAQVYLLLYPTEHRPS
jgi:hypothetical protein